MKLTFIFVNITIDARINSLFHDAQFELWYCEIYLDIRTSNYLNAKFALFVEKVV